MFVVGHDRFGLDCDLTERHWLLRGRSRFKEGKVGCFSRFTAPPVKEVAIVTRQQSTQPAGYRWAECLWCGAIRYLESDRSREDRDDS